MTVSLAPGDHEYKFVVDGIWQEDADNPRRKADPFRSAMSMLVVTTN